MSQRTVIGRVGGITPRVTAQLVRPGQATAYAANNIIANSQTAGSVEPMTFTFAEGLPNGSGLLFGAKCVAKAASSGLVTTNMAFDLLLFRPETSIPFAAGGYPADNAALSLTSAMLKQLVARFSFTAAGWVTSGLETGAGYQVVAPASGLPFMPFDLQGLNANYLRGIVQAKAAWDPGNVAQTLDFELIPQGD